MFVVLVGRPGIGKSIGCINPAIRLLQDAGTAHILSDKLTIEYVLDTLSKGFSVSSIAGLAQSMAGLVSGAPATAGMPIQFGRESTSLISAPELSVFLKHPEDALPILNQLWDSVPGKMQYGTRYKRLVEITDPCQSLLGGSAPRYLVKSIPSDAVGGGFTRRVSFVYSNDEPRTIYFPNGHGMAGLRTRADLIADLQHISTQLTGAVQFEDDKAKDSFIVVRDNSKSDEFDDEVTASYKESAWVHTLKLACILSAARSDSLTISKADIEEAYDKIQSVAKDIPRVFSGVGSGDLVSLGETIIRYVERVGYATRGAIARACWKETHNLDDIDRLLHLFTTVAPPLLIEETVGSKTLYKPISTRP
jgi:hypothetical protein